MERKRARLALKIAAGASGLALIGGGVYLVADGSNGSNPDGNVFNPNIPTAQDTIEGTVIFAKPTPTPTRTATPTPRNGRVTPTAIGTAQSPRPEGSATPTPWPTDVWTPPGTIWTPEPTEPPYVTQQPTLPPTIVWTPEPTIRPTALPTPEPTNKIEQGHNYEWADAIFNMINQIRAENGIPSLNRNTLLDKSAQGYTAFLFTNGLLPATNHDLDGTPRDRAEREGYSAFWVGEILGSSDPTAANPNNLMDAWLSSPPHRAAILSFPNPDPDLRIVDIGVGCYQGFYRVSNVIVCTAEFAIPQT